ncbi:unnamed protein product [Phaedon cochleariae]|uniref:CCDC113/CCDC96 coiled-coil domain-containing protein n=1 Tax=Phaedon cochleariae TaxID=80249 RepID=A0A9P0DP26_PHACE|nr:unnamed protein product [Phaedon cochleariae]
MEENSEGTVEATEETDQPENPSEEPRPSFLDTVSINTTATEQIDEPNVEHKEDEVSINLFRDSRSHLVTDMPEQEIDPEDTEDETGKHSEKGEDDVEKEAGENDNGEVEAEGKGENEEIESKEREDGEKGDEADDQTKGVTISDVPHTEISDENKEGAQKVEGEKAEDAEAEQKSLGQKTSKQSGISTKYSKVTITEPSIDTDSKNKAKTRKSIRKSRSIVYEIAPRFRYDDDDRLARPSGDFGIRSDTDGGSTVKFYSYMDDEAEEEEEEVVVEEEEIVRIDRVPYYERNEIIQKEIEFKKIRNYILQKKLAMFFKRRKMDRVLHETDQQIDTQQKYGKKLDMFGELIELDTSQRSTITAELENLKKRRESKFNELNKLFGNMQERENEIGLGLIDTKTGKPIPDKLVERLIRRQNVQMDEVSAMRLKFIKLKEMVVEKETAISDLDQIGEGLYLMDYEQLKVENRSHADKIEEKEEDLTRLRFRCQNTIQILAHIREKSSALDSDLDDIKEDMSMVQFQNFQVRAQLNGVKQERDYYRSMTNNLRNDSGLLTQPELLRDMESSMEEFKTIYAELENLKKENKEKTQHIRNIRKNMEFSADLGTHKSFKNVLSKPLAKPLLYKGRPSLCKPTVPEEAFEYLKDFKPKVRLLNKKK